MDDVIFDIQCMLLLGIQKPPKHDRQIINDKSSGKERIIIRPHYKYEQIIHHAVIQVLSPIIKKSMYTYSCGNVPNRGNLYAKKYIERYIHNNPKKTKYVLKLDIHHFFQSVDKTILKQFLIKKIHDKNMIDLLFSVIDCYSDTVGRGIPIGFYTSQQLANWYLEGLDHYIKEQLHADCYVRFVDDMVIFGSNKRELRKMKFAIEKYLHIKLNLTLNKKWQIYKFKKEGVTFIGYRFFPNKTILKKKMLYKIVRKVHRTKKLNQYNAAQILSFMGKFKHCDVYNVYLKQIKPKYRMRTLKHIVSRHQKMLNKERK